MQTIMKNLSGWQYVALVFILCATLVSLVWLGETIGAIVAAGVVVASALGVNIATSLAQNSVNSEKMGQLKDLGNGNLQALRDQLADRERQHADQLAEKDRQIFVANERAIALATMLPPETKTPEGR